MASIKCEPKKEPKEEEEPIEIRLEELTIIDSWEEASDKSTEALRPYSPSDPWPFGDFNVTSPLLTFGDLDAASPPQTPGHTPPGSPPPSAPASPSQSVGATGGPQWSPHPLFGGLRAPFWRMLGREEQIETVLSLQDWRDDLEQFLRLPLVRSEEELRASDLIAVSLLCGYISAAEEERARQEERYRHLDRLRMATVSRRRRQQHARPYPSGRSSHSAASLAEWRLD